MRSRCAKYGFGATGCAALLALGIFLTGCAVTGADVRKLHAGMGREEVSRIMKWPGSTEFLVSQSGGPLRLVRYPGGPPPLYLLFRGERLEAAASTRPTDIRQPLQEWIRDCKALESFPETWEQASALGRWRARRMCCLLFWAAPPSAEMLEPVEAGMSVERVDALLGPPIRKGRFEDEEIWFYPHADIWLSSGHAIGFREGRVVWVQEHLALHVFMHNPEPSMEERLVNRARTLGYIPSAP